MKIYHRSDENACGEVAWYFREGFQPKLGDPISASNIIFPDGTQRDAGSPLICGHCKKPFQPNLKDLEE